MPQGNPFNSIKLPRGSTQPTKPTEALTEEQALLLLSLPDTSHPIGQRDHAILSVLLGAGLRRSEVLSLTFNSLLYVSTVPHLIAWRTKGKTFREVDIPDWVATSFTQMCAGRRGSDLAFKLSPRGLHVLFKRYLRQAGIDTSRFSLHSCRKTAITQLLRDGVPHREVCRFSGHSSVRMVERYDQGFSKGPGPGIRLIYGGKTDATHNENIQQGRRPDIRLAWRAPRVEA